MVGRPTIFVCDFAAAECSGRPIQVHCTKTLTNNIYPYIYIRTAWGHKSYLANMLTVHNTYCRHDTTHTRPTRGNSWTRSHVSASDECVTVPSAFGALLIDPECVMLYGVHLLTVRRYSKTYQTMPPKLIGPCNDRTNTRHSRHTTTTIATTNANVVAGWRGKYELNRLCKLLV